jgi:hypothetical protein
MSIACLEAEAVDWVQNRYLTATLGKLALITMVEVK